MHYLIDGYNFLFRLSETKPSSLEEKRASLLIILNEALAEYNLSVSVVFDSSEQVRDYAQSIQSDALEVIYAPKGRSADEYIIELVELKKNPKAETVVTSDGGLARQCKHLGTRVLTIEEFIAFLIQKAKKSQKDTKPAYKETPRSLQRLLKIFEDRLDN